MSKRRSISVSARIHALAVEHCRGRQSVSGYVEALIARDLGTAAPRAQRARTATEIARARDAAAVKRASAAAPKVFRSQNSCAPAPTGEPAQRRVIDNEREPCARRAAVEREQAKGTRRVVATRPGGVF